MANLSEIFGWFSIGKTPTAQQFRDTFSSYFHKSEKLPQTAVYGLTDDLNDKASKDDLNNATTKFKGYHTSLALLQAEYPQASNKKDFFAWVGTPYPGTVHKVYADGGAWTDTGEVPTQEEIDLAEYAKKIEVDKTYLNASLLNNRYDYATKQDAREAVLLDRRALGQTLTYTLANVEKWLQSTNFIKTDGSYFDYNTGTVKTGASTLMLITIDVSRYTKIKIRKHVGGTGSGFFDSSGYLISSFRFMPDEGHTYGDFAEVNIPLTATLLKVTYDNDNAANSDGVPKWDYVNLFGRGYGAGWVTEKFIGEQLSGWDIESNWLDTDLLLETLNDKLYKDSSEGAAEIIPYSMGVEINAFQTTATSTYFYKTSSDLYGKNVTAIKINVNTVGILDIVFATGIELNSTSYKELKVFTITVSQTGIQYIELPEPYLFAVGNFIGFRKRNGFSFINQHVPRATNPVGGGFIARHVATGSNAVTWSSHDPGDLCIGVLTGGSPIKGDIPKIYELIANNTPSALKDAIVNGDNAEEIKGLIGDNQEVTVIKFKGKVFFYATQRDSHSSSTTPERIVLYDYDTTTNTVSNMRVIIDKDTVGVTSRQQVKCSYMFIYDNIMYAVVTCWHPNYCALLKSTDGENFTLVSNTIVDTVSGFKNSQYGNHCIIPYRINDYFYWYIEGYAGGWQTRLLRSKNIETGWELVGDVKGMAPTGGTASGAKAFFKDGLIKMFYHYGPNGDLPTYLAYAEADANDPLYFKAYYRPLLDLTNYKHVWTNIDQLADIEITEIDAQTYMFASLNDNSGYYGGTATTVYRWVCAKGRLSSILDLPI